MFVQTFGGCKNRSDFGNSHDLRTPADRHRGPSVAMA